MTVLNVYAVFSGKQDYGHCCCVGGESQTPVSLYNVCVYWKILLKLFPLDSNTTYCILLLCQVWYLSKNVTVFSEVPKLLRTFVAKFVVKTFPLRLSQALL